MNIEILLFGITTDLLNTTSLQMEMPTNSTISHLKIALLIEYEQLSNLNSYAFAVNEAYANDDTVLHVNDVVAIIPPVSGG